VQAVAGEGLGGFGSDVGQGLDGQRVQEGCDLLRVAGQGADAAGGGGLRGEGGQQSVVRDADGGGDAELGHDLDLEEQGEAGGGGVEVAGGAGEVEEGCVGGQRLDDGGDLGQGAEDLPVGVLARGVEVGVGDAAPAGVHPALPGEDVQSFRVAVVSSPAGCRSAQGARV
jgi:hypothetical protein